MICQNCGAAAGPDQRYCGQCGQSLSSVCPSCGESNPPGHRFCGQCGTGLTDEPQPAKLAPERRLVSILFVDLVGFTPFSEERDPEEVRAVLTDYFERAREIVSRFGGSVDKFIGDAVMAVWGSSEAHDDDAERAVRAGLEMVEAVASLGEERVEKLAARAGVMTGETSVGPGGNEQGLVVGDLVNTASRLQSIATPGTVLVGESTARLVRGSIELEDGETHVVRGREGEVAAWRAVRVVAERGGRGRAETMEPPFVGRRAELRLLKDMLHATGEERRARLVSIIGQAGIGKSRLVWEFQKYVDGLAEPVYWHVGRSPAYGEGITLWALGEMVRRRAGLSETDDQDTTRVKLAEMLEDFVPEASDREWIGQRLGALLGLEGSASGERHELLAASRSLFELISRRGTTVLVFEDLHWADPSLLDFVEELTEWSHQHPILVITLARNDLLELRPTWGAGRRGFASLHLTPLPEQEMTEMISGMARHLEEAVVRRIVDRAAGIPLFAVEFVRMMLEGDSAGEQLSVPDSVQAVISARLDRLDEDDRSLLRDASILGHTFTLDTLVAVTGRDRQTVSDQIAGLVRRELLEVVRDPRSPERGQFRWAQSLIREVAHRRIPRSDRGEGHLAAARYFLELEEPELAQIAAAHYAEALEALGEDHDQARPVRAEALEATMAALKRAVDLHAYQQMKSLAVRALEFVVEEDPRRFHLLQTAASASASLIEVDDAQRYAEELVEMAESDPARLREALAVQAQVLNEMGLADRAVRLLEERLGEEPALGLDRGSAEVGLALARAYLLTGESQRSADLAERSLPSAERFASVQTLADGLITRGTALADLGRPTEGMIVLRGALALCREHDLVSTGLRAQINIGYSSPDSRESVAATLRALEEARRSGDLSRATFLAHNAFYWRAWALELDEAEALLHDPLYKFAEFSRSLAEAWLSHLRGDAAEARSAMAKVEELEKQESDAQTLMLLQRVRSLAATFRGDFEQAFAMAWELWQSTRMQGISNANTAAFPACWQGDPEKIDRVDEGLVPLEHATDQAAGLRSMINATRVAIRGEVEEAAALAEETASWWKQRIGGMNEFMVLAAVASHLPEERPERAGLVEAARELVEASGAHGLDHLLDLAAGDH